MTHHMRLKPAPFEQIKEGTKTLELRLNDEKRQGIRVGDDIVFVNTEDDTQTLAVRVDGLYPFSTFKELYAAFDPVEYGSTSKDAYEEMYAYYSPEDEARHGVLAIRLSPRNRI